MHECPECGQACHCCGDIDDCVVKTTQWVFAHCTCCEDADDECDFDEDDDYLGHQ